MSDFKVGDKVELVAYDKNDKKCSYTKPSSNYYLPLGAIGTVVKGISKKYTAVNWESHCGELFHNSENLKLVNDNNE